MPTTRQINPQTAQNKLNPTPGLLLSVWLTIAKAKVTVETTPNTNCTQKPTKPDHFKAVATRRIRTDFEEDEGEEAPTLSEYGVMSDSLAIILVIDFIYLILDNNQIRNVKT